MLQLKSVELANINEIKLHLQYMAGNISLWESEHFNDISSTDTLYIASILRLKIIGGY